MDFIAAVSRRAMIDLRFNKDIQQQYAPQTAHPLDRKDAGWGGLEMPEDNYHRRVLGALHGILESIRGISEKSFTAQDSLTSECDQIVRRPEIEKVIQRFSTDGKRPEFCAECIYGMYLGSEGKTASVRRGKNEVNR